MRQANNQKKVDAATVIPKKQMIKNKNPTSGRASQT